jgi:pyridoxine/pyridoxamine 5'-phosphate oxidase
MRTSAVCDSRQQYELQKMRFRLMRSRTVIMYVDITPSDKGRDLIRKRVIEISFLWKSTRISCMICFQSIIETGTKNMKLYECDMS